MTLLPPRPACLPPSPDRSRYRLAAAAGHSDAQSNLGTAYSRGEGVAADKAEAVRWYRLVGDPPHACHAAVLGQHQGSTRVALG